MKMLLWDMRFWPCKTDFCLTELATETDLTVVRTKFVLKFTGVNFAVSLFGTLRAEFSL